MVDVDGIWCCIGFMTLIKFLPQLSTVVVVLFFWIDSKLWCKEINDEDDDDRIGTETVGWATTALEMVGPTKNDGIVPIGINIVGRCCPKDEIGW